jgi:hypothetical protein
MRKLNPKTEVARLCELVCPGAEVRGTRVKGRLGGDYLTEVSVGGRIVARARHRDWRMSYKVLGVQLSKLGVL